jgi:hypothetical protein
MRFAAVRGRGTTQRKNRSWSVPSSLYVVSMLPCVLGFLRLILVGLDDVAPDLLGLRIRILLVAAHHVHQVPDRAARICQRRSRVLPES